MEKKQPKEALDVHFKVLRLIQANPDITQRQLAQHLGVSVGRVNYCVKALIEKGWVKVHNFRSNQNKLSYVYLITPSGISEKAKLTGSFLKRKLKEYELLKDEIKSLKMESKSMNICPLVIK